MLRDAENRADAPIYVRLDPGTIREDERTIDVIASTQTLDSHGTILRQNWRLDRYQQSPVVLWAHDRHSLPIAKAIKVKVVGSKKDGKRLEATIRFPPEGEFDRSDEVWSAIRAGLVRGVSVGFHPHTRQFESHDDREVMVLDDNELLEISFVPVGSNPDALAKMRARALAERDPQQSLPIDHPGDAEPEKKERSMPENTESKAEARVAVLENDNRQLTEQRDALLTATGADTVDRALGVIEAGKVAAAELPKLQAQLDEQARAAEQAERAGVIKELTEAKKIAPAQREWAESCPLETLRAFAKTAPTIVGGNAAREPADATGAKPWADMTPMEKHALRKSNPDEYARLRDEANH